ncbi:hypothetical protein ILUMI_00496, partial [Ignelater luminosus]
EYTVRSGVIDSGKQYEIKTVTLLSLKCCLENLEHFWIASNVEECGDFDDIVLFTKQKNKEGINYLIQLKHQDTPKDITRKEILATKGKKYRDFSLKKYLDSCSNLSDAVSAENTKKSEIIDHFKKNPNICFALFTNRSVAPDLEFLEPIKSRCDLININGKIYGFKPEELDIFSTKEEFIRKIFLFAKQPHIKGIDNKIKNIFKTITGFVNKSEKDLDEIVRRLVSFVDEWWRGLLDGHYPLMETHILKKITEILLEPFILDLSRQFKTSEEEEDKFNLWNEIIEDRNLIIINESDEIIVEFINKFVCTSIVKYQDFLKNCRNIKKDILRIPTHAHLTSFSEFYEYLWKTQKIPLVIQVETKSEIDEVTEILRISQGIFRIIIINKSEITIDHLKSPTVKDLNEDQQQKLFKLPIKLQGRYLNGFEKLNFHIQEIFNLTIRNIIHILCDKFNIGGEFEALPDIFVGISLKRVWLKQEVLQVPTEDIFIIQCDLKNIHDNTDTIKWKKTITLEKSEEKQATLITVCTEMKSTIISANPGMGKSVFVNYFARNAPLNFWVITLNLTKYKSIYKNFTHYPEYSFDLKSFFEEILKEESKENLFLVKAIFEKFYESKNIVVLLDGFDEIPIDYQDDAKQFIKLLSKSGFFILVTTRPVLKNDLELLLDTFSLDLDLFTRKNQEYFLANYFSKFTETTCKTQAVILFVENLLDAAKNNLNDRDNEFTGVPLQTLLLAEVFMENFKSYLKTGKFVNKHFNLLCLYRSFIEKKIMIACEKFGDISEDMIRQYKTCKVLYALRLLFSEENLKQLEIDSKLEYAKLVFPNMLELVQKDGVVVAETETNIRFVHRTFAEYLVGEWLAENIKSGNKEIAKNLLKVTFDPNLKVVRNIVDRILAKNCPLHLAIINFQIDIVAGLINSNHFEDLDDGDRSFLHLLASWGFQYSKEHFELFELRKMSNEDLMVEILKLIPDKKLKNCRDEILKYTPIDYALMSFSLHIADILCQKMKESEVCINLEDLDEPLLLLYCYKMNYLALSRRVVKHTSSIDSKEDKSDSNSLHVAVGLEKEEIVKVLLHNGLDINVTDSNGKTHLHWSVLQGNLDILKLLISNEADINIVDNRGRTALHYAIIACPKHQLEIISELRKTNFEIIDTNHMTPFSWAAYYGYTECVNLLLKLGVDTDQKNTHKMTALHWAASNGHIDTINLLLSKGANINAKTQTECTPLIISARYGHANIANLLLDQGADIESQDCYGMPALHWATRNGYKDIAQLLLSYGADIKSRDTEGKTSLHWAAFGRNIDIVELLLSKGADINAEDNRGNTALYSATIKGYTEIVTFLLSKGSKRPKASSHVINSGAWT